MRRMWLGYMMLMLGALRSAAGCGTTGSTSRLSQEDRQLIKRAAFDLNYGEPMHITRIDAKTRGVRGCGRRATYVQLCDAPGVSFAVRCAWLMNGGTISAVQ